MQFSVTWIELEGIIRIKGSQKKRVSQYTFILLNPTKDLSHKWALETYDKGITNDQRQKSKELIHRLSLLGNKGG